MALSDIVQSPTGLVSAGNVATFNTPAFGLTPIVGNTDLLFAVSSSTIPTPTGYTLDESNTGFAGIYIFRRTVQAGDTGAAVTLTITSTRPCAAFRLELEGTAAISNGGAAHSNKNFSGTTTTARSATAITTASQGLIVFATDGSSIVANWSAFSNSITQRKANAPSGGTVPCNGMVAYAQPGPQIGSVTVTATSTVSSTRYQILVVGYNFTAAGPTQVSDSDSGTLTEQAPAIARTLPPDPATLTERAGLARTALDAGALSDRVGSLARTATDPAQLAERGASLARTGGVIDAAALGDRAGLLARTTADVAVLTELATVQKLTIKNVFDGFVFGDRLATLARVLPPDTAALVDRVPSMARTVADQGVLTDSGSVTHGGGPVSISTSDTGTLTERASLARRLPTDPATLAEQLGLARTLRDGGVLVEQATVVKNKPLSDTATLGERISISRTLGDSAVLSEAGPNMARSARDAATATERLVLARIVFDSATMLDRVPVMVRRQTDTAVLGERVATLRRTLADAFALADTATVTFAFFGQKLAQSIAYDEPALSGSIASDEPLTGATTAEIGATVTVAGDASTATVSATDRPASTVIASDRP